ncbi:hypothetical protein CK203_072454 [Vitis vinifera]|uniref:Uncharacterized protein n=1 Tax=Vitis vinifera TaxID=29760 RepID=A0A438F945_VITVI|nr:hypothetical protein CK203_072454 [Vitis vinifera]
MTSRRSSNVSQKTLQIEQDDRFFSRLLAKEVSVGNSSFGVYHGEASAGVPFTWESQPGTPKFKFPETPLPPLTPPPSYYSTTMKNSMKRHSKPGFLNIIFHKLTSRKISLPTSPASSTSSSSSSSQSRSSSPTTPSIFHARVRNSSRRRSFDSRAYEEDYEHESPTSTLCFGIGCRIDSRFGGFLFNYHEGIPRRFSINS